MQRIEQLADTLPKKELDNARAEVQSIQGQIAALSSGIHWREALRSPSSGVIALSEAISGKVFNAGELVFEVSNPSVIRLEARWFEANALPTFDGASVFNGNQVLKLDYAGASNSVQDQSLILVFESRHASGVRCATGQLVKVYAEQAGKTEGIAIASTAVVKNASNQTIVWVKNEPESFVPKVVVTQPLNGAQVWVKSGLAAGDRIVVQGTALINQLR